MGKEGNLKEIANISIEELYNGETADNIAKRKGLRYHEYILDNMGEEVEKYQKHNRYIK